MNNILYGVIILNYNTPHDAINAAQNVIANATVDNYRILIVDNMSTSDLSVFQSFEDSHVDYLYLKNNRGYANGNNDGIEKMIEEHCPQFTVIMNPDVLLLEKGTIEGLISKYQTLPDGLCGIAPLVWNPNLSDSPRTQITASRATSYFDKILLSGGIAKRLFKKRYEQLTYMDLMPYYNDFDAENVSGAFFIVNTLKFKEVGFFDNRTFLYGEEILLGFKFKQKGFHYLVCPSYIVEHEGGKSTKATFKRVTKRSVVYDLESSEVYLKECLRVSKYKIWIYRIYVWSNFYIKYISYLFKK